MYSPKNGIWGCIEAAKPPQYNPITLVFRRQEMANFRATVTNSRGMNDVSLRLNEKEQTIQIPAKAQGYGSSVSGGELLFLALATCYCNDIYREAAKRGIQVEREGGAASNVTYRARVKADGSEADILDLMHHTDTVAEIKNTLRAATPVELSDCEVID
jgi:organic hydroperoxide reductase OsmC/OhrA